MELFMRHVDKDGPIPPARPELGPCWLWAGKKNKKGYGEWRTGRLNGQGIKIVRAHKFMYEETVGPVPEGLELDHLCRNRPCCRPDHLEPVTHHENSARGDTWKHQSRKTHCPKGHPYDEKNTYRYKNRRGSVIRGCKDMP